MFTRTAQGAVGGDVAWRMDRRGAAAQSRLLSLLAVLLLVPALLLSGGPAAAAGSRAAPAAAPGIPSAARPQAPARGWLAVRAALPTVLELALHERGTAGPGPALRPDPVVVAPGVVLLGTARADRPAPGPTCELAALRGRAPPDAPGT